MLFGLGSDSLRHRNRSSGVSCGVWHQGVGGRYLLQGGPVRIRLVPLCSVEAQSEWDLGNVEAGLT